MKKYSLSLFGFELRRLMSAPVTALVAALLILSALDSYRIYSAKLSSSMSAYESYVSENCLGPVTAEVSEHYRELYNYAREFTSVEHRNEVGEEYAEGKITYDEFIEYLDEARELGRDITSLEMLNSALSYLERTARDTGAAVWLMPSSRLERMLGRDVNVFLLAALAFVISRTYAADYAGKSSEGNFAAILRTTRLGRRTLFRSRLLVSVLLSVAFALLFSMSDIAVGAAVSERFFDVLSAPSASMEPFHALGGVTVGGFIALSLFARVAASVMIAVLTCAASYFTKNAASTLFVTALFTLLPYALVYIDVPGMKYADITVMLAGGRLFTRSAELVVGGSPFAFAAILVCGYGAVAAAASLAVRAKVGK